jgi:hypothetical protein
MNSYECVHCKRIFFSQKGLGIHYRRSKCSTANYVTSTRTVEDHGTMGTLDVNDESFHHAEFSPTEPEIATMDQERDSDTSEDSSNNTIGDDTSDLDPDSDVDTLPFVGVLTTSHDYKEEINKEQTSSSSPSSPYSSNEQSDELILVADETLLHRYRNHVRSKTSSSHLNPPTYRSDLELLHLLQKANAPISMYEQIQRWARKSYAINPIVFTRSHLSRPKVLSLIQKKYDLEGIYPTPEVVRLPAANLPINIQTYDFYHAVYSLLTDPVLMREENLDLDFTSQPENNPLYPFPKPAMHQTRDRDFEYKEFTDGDMYCIAYNKYCSDVQIEDRYIHMPLIIIGQLDKTFLDSKGKLTLEPFKISLHIFKEKVRRRDIAWRPLGYICNQANLPKYKNPRDKACDYHFILQQILKSFKKYCETYDVVLWDMKIRQSIVHVAFNPVFGFIIGDNEGHDRTCGKYLNRTTKVHRLCRYCDTPTDRSDDPFYDQWHLTKACTISQLVSTGQVEKLQSMSYHCIENATTGIKFADPTLGINGGTPAERLHVLNHGIFQFILEHNFGQKRAKRTTASIEAVLNPRISKESGEVSSPEPDPASQDSFYDSESTYEQTNASGLVPQPTLSHIQLFTPAVCDKFDRHAKIYGRILQKQSSRYWSRSFFYNGITSNSKKVGHEERNCLLLCLLIYTSACHEYYSSILDPVRSFKKRKNNSDGHSSKRLDYLIELISETLLLEQFMMQKSIPKSTLSILRKYIPLYLQFLKDVCPRDNGMGWRLTKFHILLHLVSDIERMSIPLNFDSNVVESHHKEEKKGGNLTQMRSSKLEKQTGIRRTEHILLNRAYSVFHPPGTFMDDDEKTFPVLDDGSTTGTLSVLKMIYDVSSGMWLTNKKGVRTEVVVNFPGSTYLCGQVNKFLRMLFHNTRLPPNGVGIYTRLTMGGHYQDDNDRETLFRGDPLWSSSNVGGVLEGFENEDGNGDVKYDPWHDFAYVQWRTQRNETIIPARIIFFLTIPEGCQVEDSDHIVYPPGPYALVQSCVEELNADPPSSKSVREYYRENYGNPSDLKNYLAHPSCSILFWTVMETEPSDNNREHVPKLYLTNTNNICGSCIAVPYDLQQKPTIEWIVLRNRDEWEEIFVSDMKVRVQST